MAAPPETQMTPGENVAHQIETSREAVRSRALLESTKALVRPRQPVVLVAEDEAIIAFEVADLLKGAGYTVAGPVSTCAEALACLGADTPDLAILDILLSDGPCTEVARELRQRGVPLIVYSGYSQQEAGPEFQEAIWLEKLASDEDLLQIMHQLLTSKAA